jgi:MFS family permease
MAHHLREANNVSQTGLSASGVELPSLPYRVYILFLLTVIAAISAVDRQIFDILVEPIKAEFGLSDSQVGALNGLAYAGVYAIAVIPLARLADRHPRRLVIAVSVALWSAATTVSSAAKSFIFLFVARMGVGFGEAGLSSPGPALLSDLFPKHQRGTVTSVYMAGPAIGMGLAYAIGGWAITNYGWRSAFLLAGIPGLIVAPLFYFTVRNFPKGMADGLRRDPVQPPFFKTLKTIFAIRTVVWLIGGLACLALMVNGVLRWIPAYLTRIENIDAVSFGATLGTAIGAGSFVGHMLGGPLSDFVGRRDMRRQLTIGILATIGAVATIWAMFQLADINQFYILAGVLSFTGGIFAAPLIMICTTLPPVWARATTAAVTLMAIYLIGFGLGPALIGMLSDMLASNYGENSLRAALLFITLLAIPGVLCFLMAARFYRADIVSSEAQLARDAAADFAD